MSGEMTMAFELPPLPFEKNALEPHISAETLEYHHGKHHNAYVTALNGFVEKNADLQGKSLEEIIAFVKDKPDMAPVFNNAGQHWNHIHFWNALSPTGGAMPGKLEAKIGIHAARYLVNILGLVVFHGRADGHAVLDRDGGQPLRNVGQQRFIQIMAMAHEPRVARRGQHRGLG